MHLAELWCPELFQAGFSFLSHLLLMLMLAISQNNITKRDCYTKVFQVLNIMFGIWAPGSVQIQINLWDIKIVLGRNSTDLPGSDSGNWGSCSPSGHGGTFCISKPKWEVRSLILETVHRPVRLNTYKWSCRTLGLFTKAVELTCRNICSIKPKW